MYKVKIDDFSRHFGRQLPGVGQALQFSGSFVRSRQMHQFIPGHAGTRFPYM